MYKKFLSGGILVFKHINLAILSFNDHMLVNNCRNLKNMQNCFLTSFVALDSNQMES